MPDRGRPRSFGRSAALKRAMEVFWDHGYEGASISDLTKAMGINAPSLYAAFGSKEQLFREAVDLYDATEGSATERALLDQPTAREAVEAMLRNNAEAYSNPDNPRGCMIVLAAMTANPRNRAVRDHLTASRRSTLVALQERMDRAVEEGDLPAGTDTAALAGFYYTVLEGLSIEARDGVPREDLARTVDCAMAAWDALARPRATA